MKYWFNDWSQSMHLVDPFDRAGSGESNQLEMLRPRNYGPPPQKKKKKNKKKKQKKKTKKKQNNKKQNKS